MRSSFGVRSARTQAILPAVALAAIVAGVLARLLSSPVLAGRIWLVGLIATGTPLLLKTVRGALHGRFAADLVASLAIVGAVILRDPLPGLIIVLMQSGGEALDRLAAGRASRAIRALEAGAPRHAHRLGDQKGLEDVPAEAVAVGDRLLVRPGEPVPCDAIVIAGDGHVDTSRLTGEPIPVHARPGVRLPSGSINGESALTVVAIARAEESQYARIVQLVREAQASKAPIQRVADRYAVWFTPVTLLVCGLAYLASGNPDRVLAVLVIATPCPLILAAPIAVIGGISRAARRGVIFRTGEALERLGTVTCAVFDKTGTLTIGRPAVESVRAARPFDEPGVLRLAAGVEQGSSHMLARSVVDAAEHHGSTPLAQEIVETPGQGVTGLVEGHLVTVGSPALVAERHPSASALAELDDGGLRAWVAVDGNPGGVITFADQLRSDLTRFLHDLEARGVRRGVLVTGDHAANAAQVAEAAGLGEYRADLTPADKVDAVQELEQSGERVLMVGDGTNDAPALSAATVGVALAAHGGGVSAEAADVVLVADDLGLIPEAIDISRRTLAITRQSIWAGLGLSAIGMGFAAAGLIPPVAGAMLQELIDLGVITNALRASTDRATTT